jgi:hypothetical protein
VILHHEFPVLEVPPEVLLVLRVPAGLPALDAAVVEYAPHSHHSLLLLGLKKQLQLCLTIIFFTYSTHLIL